MTHSITRILFPIALLLGASALHAEAPANEAFKIRLKTNPTQLRVGLDFELIWQMSAGIAQVLGVFVDCTDSFGPEHRWEHDGDGVFESKVKHVGTADGSKMPRSLILKQDGQVAASTPLAWRTRVPHKIAIENYLSLVAGSCGGGKNLYGIGELINQKPLVVPGKP